MLFLYNFVINCYVLLIHTASLFSPKAKLWVEGRKHWKAKLIQFNTQHPQGSTRRIWIHCASLGEFEQGRPLLEAIKAKYPESQLILSFFSPSGYEIRKNYPHAALICYLPIDRKMNANTFIELVNPQIAIFVKYEFWHHYLTTLATRAIPTYLISAVFRADQIFFKPYGAFFRKLLAKFTHIFVQDHTSFQLLKEIGCNAVTIAGDTRVDRVAQIPKEDKQLPLVAQFVQNQKCLVAGSTWPPDEALLAPILQQAFLSDWKIIIAPHDISETHLKELEAVLKKDFIRFSQYTSSTETSHRILLIDNIGMLQAIYRYGTVAYIGGGFGAGIHNTLEPIAFGLPVIFGPKYHKFEEARQLLKNGGGFSINDGKSLQQIIQSLMAEAAYTKASKAAKGFIEENKGSALKIMTHLFN
ncbi:MAG: glycosyltransferase N-terminal domain-containing protein [Saprospiraceae bacterium]